MFCVCSLFQSHKFWKTATLPERYASSYDLNIYERKVETDTSQLTSDFRTQHDKVVLLIYEVAAPLCKTWAKNPTKKQLIIDDQTFSLRSTKGGALFEFWKDDDKVKWPDASFVPRGSGLVTNGPPSASGFRVLLKNCRDSRAYKRATEMRIFATSLTPHSQSLCEAVGLLVDMEYESGYVMELIFVLSFGLDLGNRIFIQMAYTARHKFCFLLQ